MISFALACPEGHTFEGWFANSGAFEKQRDGDAIICPICGSGAIDKALMAPAIATGRAKEAVRVAAHLGEEPAAAAALRKLRERLIENADYVGDRFAEEARRIHYEEAEKRGIYGEATAEEVRKLAEEEIEFHPLPVLPEDHN